MSEPPKHRFIKDDNGNMYYGQLIEGSPAIWLQKKLRGELDENRNTTNK